MKKLILVLFGLMSFNVMALEMTEKAPILVKNQTPGFAPVQYRQFKKCEVYMDKIVIEKGVGPLMTSEVREHAMTGPMLEVLEAVHEAKKEITQGPTDVPTTSYSFWAVEDNTTIQNVFEQRGFRMISTEGSAAQLLKNFMDKVCGE